MVYLPESCFSILFLVKICYCHRSHKFQAALFILGARCWWRSWLRHCATSRKVAGSIPDGVIGIFHCHNPSRPHYGPGVDSASNRNKYQEYFLVGKGGRCVGLTTLPPSCADCLEIWEPQPPGILRARCWWRSWLRHCATNRKVAGSILYGVIGIFH